LIWGTAFAFSKFVLGELTVSQLVFLRFGLGSLALLPIIILRRTRLDRKDLPRFILTGFLAVPVTFLLQFNGLALTTTARASLIIGAAPPLLALGGAIFLGERPGLRGWVAVATSMLGILVISGSPGGDGSWSGDGLVFLSIVVSVVWVILNKRLSEKYSALIATAYIMLFGTLTLAPFTLLWDGLPRFDLPLTVWLAVLVLGLICTALAFVLWNWGLERVPASKAGIYLNLEPLVGALLGVIVFRESLGAGVFLGGLLIIGAALIAAQPERKPMGDEVEFDLDKPRDPSINLYHQKSIRLRGCGQINN
jgi:drug/metabolite transporter (DMT)-like permease